MEIRLPNPTEKLRPGLIAQVKVVYGKKDPIILIPLDAVIGFGTEPSVFIVKDGKARRRIIKMGEITGERVEVFEGLVPGDTLVVAGQEYLTDGREVAIQQAFRTMVDTK
jgi:Fe2+ transport system protein FeoA